MNSLKTINKKLEKMKAATTAKISSYLTELEVAKVEIAEANIDMRAKK